MGADIHLYVEYKDDNGKWVLNENQKCKECNWIEPTRLWDICSYCFGNKYEVNSVGRSYVLFSILADVRNDSGLNPISDLRGIPEDASEEYKEEATINLDDHSHSYHTLKQLKEYEGKWDGGKYDWEYLKGYFPLDLEELAQKHGGDDNVRIVFFFDN